MYQAKAEKFLWIYKSPLAKTVKFNLLKKMPVGQKLEEARKRKGVSLREVSESTKIRGDYLSAIESGNYEINLPEVYLRGFVRLYAKFLGMDQDAMVADLDTDLGKSGNKSSKKSLGSIVSRDHSESLNKSKNQSSANNSAKRSFSSKYSLSLPVVLSLVGLGVTLLLVLLIYFWSQDKKPTEDNIVSSSITEASDNNEIETQLQDVNLSNSKLLTISITGDVTKLIVCDEGKSPPVFHEFDNLDSGWSTEIQFEKSFRCYSSQIENIIVSIDGSSAQKIGGDKQGVGTFSWRPSE